MLALCLGFAASIYYCRLFLGVHSLDQVIYGGFLGLWFSLTLHYCLADWLIPHVDRILYDRIQDHKRLYMLNTIVMFGVIVFSISDYAIVHHYFIP